MIVFHCEKPPEVFKRIVGREPTIKGKKLFPPLLVDLCREPEVKIKNGLRPSVTGSINCLFNEKDE